MLVGCLGSSNDRGNGNNYTQSSSSEPEPGSLEAYAKEDPGLTAAELKLMVSLKSKIDELDDKIEDQSESFISATDTTKLLQVHLGQTLNMGCVLDLEVDSLKITMQGTKLEDKDHGISRVNLFSSEAKNSNDDLQLFFDEDIFVDLEEWKTGQEQPIILSKPVKLRDLRYVRLDKKGYNFKVSDYNEDHYQAGMLGNKKIINERYHTIETHRYRLESIEIKALSGKKEPLLLYSRSGIGYEYAYHGRSFVDYKLRSTEEYTTLLGIKDCE